MKRKYILYLGVVLLFVILLSGCSSPLDGGIDEFLRWGLGISEKTKPEESNSPEEPLVDNENAGLPVSGTLPPYDDGELHEVLDAYGVYESGSAIQTTHFRVAYLDCVTNVEIDSEFFGPSEGYRVVGAYFSFENNSKDASDCGRYDFVCYADDVACKEFYAARVDELDGSINLSPGRKHEGWAFFEVPEKAQRVEVEYTGDGYWASTAQKPIFVIG